MKATAFALVLCMATVLNVQIRENELARVASDDAAMPVLREWRSKKIEKCHKGGIATISFSPWYELPSPALKQLFPGLRFFATSWTLRPIPGKEKETIGLPSALEIVLILDADGKSFKEVATGGDHEPFWNLLAAHKVSIRSPADAKLVWEAFCDLHLKHWQDQPALKISETTWHLGDTTIDKFHYYYEFVLDDDHVVKWGKLHAEPVNKPPSKRRGVSSASSEPN
jgi:hypothetical protein